MSEENRFKRYIVIALGIPIVILFGILCLNIIVDPFNMNKCFDLDLDKEKVSYKANYRLFKMLSYINTPVENIFLGDSRMDGLDKKYIEKVSGDKYFNFAYGGGTAYEVIDTFWFAAGKIPLKSVYIGINFNLYHAGNRMNLVPQAEELIQNKAKYYLSPFVTKISLFNLYYKVFQKNPVSETPPMPKDEFWKKQLGKNTDCFYNDYEYPVDIKKGLKEIGKYCNEHDIALTIIIPPTHIELQEKVKDHDLEVEFQQYKKDLCEITRVIDYDYPNDWTRNKALFKDPYHADNYIRNKMVEEIWGNHLSIGYELR